MSEYFKTSDGTNFYQENDAKNHAKTLEDKTITLPSIGVEVEDLDVIGENVETGEGSTDGAPKEIKLSKLTKAQLIAFAVENELTIDEAATNAVIVESIEAQLTEKNQE
jgi:hypothetical protein